MHQGVALTRDIRGGLDLKIDVLGGLEIYFLRKLDVIVRIHPCVVSRSGDLDCADSTCPPNERSSLNSVYFNLVPL